MESFVLAEFDSPAALLEAVRRLRDTGWKDVDFHSPYPLHGGDEALGRPPSRIPLIALIGGLCGAGGGYLMQWYLSAVDFPLNVGNRPPHSPPAFIPITFELGVLISSLSIFVGLWALLGLPRLHHPVFEVEAFRSASTHGFWASIEVEAGEEEVISRELTSLGALQISLADGRR
jgi:hypothetical protein